MPIGTTTAPLAMATGGMNIPIEILLSIFGGSGLSGLLGAQDSPRDKAVQDILEKLERNLSFLSTPSISKGEVESGVSDIQQTFRGGANVAATATGTALSESLSAGGTPTGQPKGEIYTSALAPVIAAGEDKAAMAKQWGMQFWASLDDAAKNRMLAGMGLMGDVANMQPTMTPGQEGVSSFLQTLNLLSTGWGNLAQGWKDYNHKPITV